MVDPHGRIVRKSGNLFQDELQFDSLQTGGRFFNAKLSRAPVRQVQIAIVNAAGAPVGYIILAAPLKDAELVLNNLLAVLAVLFPIIQVVLFWISRLMAGRSILPVENIITTAERITRENLRERMDLPVHQDELYRLSATINQLLDRLEDSLLREKQFTADASHELRTPLSAVMGTLEVLARKPRSVEHYQTRIGESIRELKRMSDLIDRLLMLARYDSEKLKPQLKPVEMRALIGGVVARLADFAAEKKIAIEVHPGPPCAALADAAMTGIIVENILSNALKYARPSTTVEIDIQPHASGVFCRFTDQGPGIDAEKTEAVFGRFYRTDDSRNSAEGGFGLGLSIVRKLADLQGFRINLNSEKGIGTTLEMVIPPAAPTLAPDS